MAALIPAAFAHPAVPTQSTDQLQKLETQLRERDEKLTALLSDKSLLANELKQMREAVATAKKANAAQPDTHDYSEAETRDYFTELGQKVAGLPTELVDDDEDAKRFDLLVLRTQLAILQALPSFETLRQPMQAIASALELQEAIPAIKAQMVLIQAIAGDEWWQDVTVTMLEVVRRRLRVLVKLIERGKKNVVYTDFEDEFGTGSAVALPGVGTGMNLARFKSKAMAWAFSSVH